MRRYFTAVCAAVFCAVAIGGIINSPNDHMGHGGVVIDASKLMTPAIGNSGLRITLAPSNIVANPSDIGAFRTSCKPSHMAFDDPIAKPGQPGKSHLHVFAGNTKTDAYTTPENIRLRGASTCPGGSANKTAYWVPALIDTATGTPLVPLTFENYYKTGYNKIVTTTIQAMPAGLRMIAGDMTNSIDVQAGAPWNFSPYVWKCMDTSLGYAVSQGQQIPACPAGPTMQLWAIVLFPQCWDGVNLDSLDHKSHMSYLRDGLCPATHPIALPEISFNVEYAAPNGTDGWRLSSDMYDDALPAGRSMHGDWFNGWDQDVLRVWVGNCDQGRRDCHNELLGDGRMLF